MANAPNISGDIFPQGPVTGGVVGWVAQIVNGVVQVWNGSAWVTYTPPVTLVPAPNPGEIPYPVTSGLVQVAGGSSGVNYTLPPISGSSSITVIKSDNTTGIVTVVTADGSLINGQSSYELTNQYQYVTISALNGNWNVTGNN